MQQPGGTVFARYWREHGGLAVFGAPITAVFQATNGDGSDRRYQMLYCANARLEWHPESRDPRYLIQVGLLGTESLVERSWTRP
jgi:hypothetical protein